MNKSRLMLAVAIGATLMAIGILPVWAADAEPTVTAKETTPAEETQLPLESCEWDSDLVLDATGLIPLPGGRGCLSGGPPNTCDDYPVAVGGSCSCSSTLTSDKCRECDSRKRGLVLETTCTICPPCYSPPCQIQDCTDRTSRICSI